MVKIYCLGRISKQQHCKVQNSIQVTSSKC